MCGIAGIVDFADPPCENGLARMIRLIRHRGPDACGIYRDEVTGLAHARLSIIDLSGGDQPIHNEDHSIWIVYNGEVFNFPELRQRLESRGHQFYTQSDTEVLVHLYEEMGADLFGELNGQFAFALWDRRKGQLVLGRDRLGIRPLFYFQKGGHLSFASEVKALFADSRVPRALDPAALADTFTCWAPVGEMTSFRDIYQILPGHFALFSRNGWTQRPYWRLAFSPDPPENRPVSAWKEELQALLRDSIRIRLRADVPVGAYLSGGLDSTFITSLVKKFFNNQLCTFSVSFTDDRFDEAPFQEKAVQALNTAHRRIRCTESDIGESFPEVVWHAEVPLLRTAPAPMFQLSRLVRQSDFKVVLTGEGSDEIFAGYDIFKESQIRYFWSRRPDSKIRPRLLQRLYPDIFSNSDSRTRIFLENFFRKGLERTESSRGILTSFAGKIPRRLNPFSLRKWAWDNGKDEFRESISIDAPSGFHEMGPPFTGPVRRDLHFSGQLSSLLPGRPDGHGPCRRGAVSLSGLPRCRVCMQASSGHASFRFER